MPQFIGTSAQKFRLRLYHTVVNIVIHLRLLVHLLGHLLVYLFVKLLDPDMEFVKNFTHPDFQAKSFTPQKCVICDSFFGN